MTAGHPRRRGLAWRRLGALLVGGVAVASLSAAAFLAVAHKAQPDFQPIREALPPGREAAIDKIPHYRRDAAGTYLTFPEWYLVFAPQEYARYLHGGRPSRFPYLRLIRQFWSGYAQVYGLTRRSYPFDFGKNLMVVVIGTSSTVEFGIKGAYENTVGRLSEWSAGGATTPEDGYAAEVAKEYGDFIPTEPWFDFPFAHKLVGLWTGLPLFGPHFQRKCERRFFLSLEYGVKSLYAGVIRLASHAVYGVADTEVYASVRNLPEQAFAASAAKKVQRLDGGAWIITLPHYQGFTDTVPNLAAAGMDFDEVAGNGEILLTLTAPSAWSYDLADGRRLFAMPLLTGPETQRIAVQVPVRSLGAILRKVRERGLAVEHLFDY
jgi:hypothetical protein